MKNIFLVDADDTILDFHGSSALALRAAFEKSGIEWKEEYLASFRSVNDGLWEGLERKELTREELMERRFPLYLVHLGLTEYDGNEFNRLFLEHLATHPLYIDGAQDFLRTLREMGRVYIVTNGTAWIQKSRFSLAGLYSYAEEVFVSQTVGHDKPAKEYTDYVLSHIPNFCRGNAVWIGDSLSADIKAANEAKIASVWFNPRRKKGAGEINPDFTATSFDEVIKWLKN